MRRLAHATAAAAALLFLGGCISGVARSPARADLLIRGGTVYDGISSQARQADVAITGDRVSLVGDGERLAAARVIDARGLIVAPGFVDPHTHSEADLMSTERARRFLANHLMQGVTTIVVGNDGGGSPDVQQRLRKLGEQGAGTNVAILVGFGEVRRRVVGEEDRAPSARELEAMKQLVASAMCEGAIGFSAGLYYTPQSFAETSEVITLAREAALRSGIYETHLRDEGSGTLGLIPALDEAIKVGRDAGLPVHVAHIKALGVEAQGQAPAAIARIEAARRSGVRVTADQYPWLASGTRLTSALVPGWALDGGREAFRRRIADPALRPRLEQEMAGNLRRRGGAEAVLVTGGSRRGQRLDALARSWSVAPVAAALRVIEEEGDAPIASFNMSEADLMAFRRQPWLVTSSDASAGHPRRFGSFARAWRLFVREHRLLSPGDFIRRSSGLTAELLGLGGRGSLRDGGPADVVVFDPATFDAAADYSNPTALARGVRTVLVNGRLAVDEGQPTGALAGRPLGKPHDPSWSCPK